MVDKQNPAHERRKSPRVAAVCRCWIERESVTLLGTVTNVGFGGLYIRTPVTLANGSHVDVTLNLADGLVVARGKVVWSSKLADSIAPPGLGITFNEILGGRDHLHRYLEQNKNILAD